MREIRVNIILLIIGGIGLVKNRLLCYTPIMKTDKAGLNASVNGYIALDV